MKNSSIARIESTLLAMRARDTAKVALATAQKLSRDLKAGKYGEIK